MSGSCYLDRALNVEIGVEHQIFVIVIFSNSDQKKGALSKYYKGALTQKRSFSVVCILSDLIFMSAEKIKTNI